MPNNTLNNLPGSLLGRLLDSFVEAFPTDGDLRELSLVVLEMPFDSELRPGTLRERALSVIQWAKKNGKLEALITGAQSRREDNQRLRLVGSELLKLLRSGGSVARQANQNTEGDTAREGLAALAESLAFPATRAAVGAFQADFAAARDQIAVLTEYKTLHDRFQDVEGAYYPVYHIARRQRFEASQWDELELNAVPLIASVEQLLALVANSTRASQNMLWTKKLIDATTELQNATAHQDDGGVRRSMAILNDVLGREPSKLNTRLVSAAAALRLAALETAMSLVSGELSRLGEFDRGRIHLALLTDGAAAMSSVRASLERFVLAHNIFQEIDDELRLIEIRIQHGAEEVRMNCQLVIAKSHHLAIFRPPFDWSEKFEQLCTDLDLALGADNQHGLLLAFERLRSFVILRFRQVDRDLLELCESLRAVGDQATRVLDILQEGAGA